MLANIRYLVSVWLQQKGDNLALFALGNKTFGRQGTQSRGQTPHGGLTLQDVA